MGLEGTIAGQEADGEDKVLSSFRVSPATWVLPLHWFYVWGWG